MMYRLRSRYSLRVCDIEEIQIGIDRSERAPNSAERIRARIRTHNHADAPGWWLREITPRQRYVKDASADPDSVFQIGDHADHFIGVFVIPNALPDCVAISEKPACGAFIQDYRQSQPSAPDSSRLPSLC